uniref:PAP_RNA-bind domain-containing protein n=1 Tax=Mesocestoides corti TaxID=53468 RepID=A0A5K3FI03_MESCO
MGEAEEYLLECHGLPWRRQLGNLDLSNLPTVPVRFAVDNRVLVFHNLQSVALAETRQAVVKEILLRKRPWSDLFEPAFFFTYRHYIVVIVSGEEKRCFTERCGLVESRLRVLVSKAERKCCVKIAHVNCRAYDKGPGDGADAAFVKKWFIGMEFDREPISSTAALTNYPATAAADAATAAAALATAAAAAAAADSSAPPPKLNIDLSDVISSLEVAIERGMCAGDTRANVTLKYARRSQLSQFLSAEDMVEIRRQFVAHVAAKQCLTVGGDSAAVKEKAVGPQSNVRDRQICKKRPSTDAFPPTTNARLRDDGNRCNIISHADLRCCTGNYRLQNADVFTVPPLHPSPPEHDSACSVLGVALRGVGDNVGGNYGR